VSAAERDFDQYRYSGALTAAFILKLVAALIVLSTALCIAVVVAHRHTFPNATFTVVATSIGGLTSASLLAAVGYIVDLLVDIYDEQLLS